MNIFELALQSVILSVICCVAVFIEKESSVPYWIVIPVLIGIAVTVSSAIGEHMKRRDKDGGVQDK